MYPEGARESVNMTIIQMLEKSEARLLKLGDELTLCGVDDPITVS